MTPNEIVLIQLTRAIDIWTPFHFISSLLSETTFLSFSDAASPNFGKYFIILRCYCYRLAQTIDSIMSTVLFFQLLFTATAIAICMFAIGSNTLFGISSITSMIALTTVAAPTFILCLLSENLTADLHGIGNNYYSCAWYRLTAKQQQLFVLPIQRSQKEFRMTGLGLVDCSLRVFSSVRLKCLCFSLI